MPYAPPVHPREEHLAWVRDVLVPAGGVFVAERDGAVAGAAALRQEPGCGWIDQLYVSPQHWGEGVGTQLLRYALTELRGPVRLVTFQQNTRARELYERYGFRAIEFRDGSANEENCPDVVYERSTEDVSSL